MSEHTPLPCPFCGGTNLIVVERTCDRASPYNPADFAYPRVICKCGVEVPGKNWTGKETAVAAWNTRASVNLLPDLVEGLRTAKSHLVTLRGDRRDDPYSDGVDRAVFDVIDALIAKETA